MTLKLLDLVRLADDVVERLLLLAQVVEFALEVGIGLPRLRGQIDVVLQRLVLEVLIARQDDVVAVELLVELVLELGVLLPGLGRLGRRIVGRRGIAHALGVLLRKRDVALVGGLLRLLDLGVDELVLRRLADRIGVARQGPDQVIDRLAQLVLALGDVLGDLALGIEEGAARVAIANARADDPRQVACGANIRERRTLPIRKRLTNAVRTPRCGADDGGNQSVRIGLQNLQRALRPQEVRQIERSLVDRDAGLLEDLRVLARVGLDHLLGDLGVLAELKNAVPAEVRGLRREVLPEELQPGLFRELAGADRR